MKTSLSISLFLVAVLTCCTFGIHAQNWECIKTEDECYYGNSSGNGNDVILASIRIDSIDFVDSLIYYQNIPRFALNGSCYTPFGNSFLGSKVFSNDWGTYFFINNSGDTLNIRSLAKLGEEWLAYKNASIIVNAKIAWISDTTFLQLFDSIKLIRFQAKDSSGLNKPHYINNISIILSKNYGFIKILQFDAFPNAGTYNILGIKSVQKGYQNIGSKEIWDINPGDEIHYEFSSEFFTGGGIWGPYEENQYIKRLISKEGSYDTSMSFTYETIQHHIYYDIYNALDTIYPQFISTVVIDFNNDFNSRWNTLPGGSSFGYEAFNFVVKSKLDSILQIKAIEYPGYDQKSYGEDSCYFQNPETYYYEAVRGTGVFNYQSVSRGSVSHRELKYFKKGDVSWGTPYTFAFLGNVSFNAIDPTITVYPNPVKNFVSFKIIGARHKNCKIEIYTVSGVKVLETILYNNETNIDTSKLSSGIYFYNIDDVIRGKFIKLVN